MKNRNEFKVGAIINRPQKSNNGITLVALVVTIIVLLILAGVSLNLVAGSNGILSRANNAVNATKQAQLEEELQLGLAEIMMDYYIEGNGKSLQEYIIEQCNKTENNGMLEVGNGTFSSIDGDLYYTDSNGNISMITVDNNGNVSIEGSVSADGTVNDTNPPSIFATATTNSISLVLKDPLSGVAAWAYSTTNAEPTMWNEVSGKSKSHSETITGLTNGTTYYVWARDANGNVSQAKEVTTKNFDELSYDVTWEGAMATIVVKSPSSGLQFKTSQEGNWENYTESNKPKVESNTTVYFQVTDGNNIKTFETVKPLKPSTVTYHGNGGSGDFTETAEHTTNVSVNFATKPTRANYEFVGWSKRADVGYADYSESGTKSFEVGTENIDLYAIWKGTTKETMNSANYGDKVNYSANGESNWKIFYNDGTYVYAIIDEYVLEKNIPTSIGAIIGTNNVTGYGTVVWSLSSVPNFQSEWSLYKDSFLITGYTLNSSCNGSRFASTLLNANNWNSFANGVSGSKNISGVAIGSPTLEMWIKSWNEKGYSRLYCGKPNDYGYQVSGDGVNYDYGCGVDSKGYNDQLYFPLQNKQYYWLSTPSCRGISALSLISDRRFC